VTSHFDFNTGVAHVHRGIQLRDFNTGVAHVHRGMELREAKGEKPGCYFDGHFFGRK